MNQILLRSMVVWTMLTAVSLAAAPAPAPTPAPASPPLSFNRDIRPILSNHCFQCHGPDEKVRKGNLRLDTEEGALADLDGNKAVVRGKPADSELMRRIRGAAPGKHMPPKKTGKTLTKSEIDTLQRWIEQGAPYAKHWSYVKPERPELPKVKDAAWPKNPIDHFILARLEREGLKPAPQADRYALIRRVSLDLTGLPPSVKEVDDFVKDPDPKAYDKLVSRLLAKKTYGEYWAHLWLDLARYADSAGYADDPARTIWLYRDYVIQSINDNKPFDQFTIEQIAGDLLPNPTEEQIIATAFHRNTLTNNEGGTNDEEFRNVAVVDRVNTTLAVWMGTTMACAQCHTHKYDPISQEEYFQVFAILNNTEDADRGDESPLFTRYSEEQKKQKEQWQAEIAKLQATLNAPSAEIKAGQAKWEESFAAGLKWQSPAPAAVTSQAKAAVTLKDGTIRVAGGAAKDTYTIELPLDAMTLRALRIDALPDDALPSKGPGHAGGNFVITGIKATVTQAKGKPQAIAFNVATSDYHQPNFEAASVLNNKNLQKGWAVGGQIGQPHTLTLATSAGVAVTAGSKLILTIEQNSVHANHTLGHFKVSVTDSAQAAESVKAPAAVVDALKVPAGKRTPAQQEAVARFYLSVAPGLQAERQKLADLNKQLAALKPITVPIMRELKGGQRRKTKIQHRGNFLDLGKEVTEGTPAAFPPLPPGPRDRLALAKWLVDDKNPLTARVTANRLWEQIFGTGIVASSEEFGAQGELPFHPELLDWLATELVHLKWNQKEFLRLLVTSAAYQQSSKVSPELIQRDPDNRLLSRGPRFRLSAETVRDQALAVSGLLSGKMFGPPVKPPQPSSGLSAAFGSGIDWQSSTGEDRYRRGLYTMWRRSNPYPSMATFDAPNREVCTVRRVRTNTPLQALVTLNDPVYVEASQALARKVVLEGGIDARSRATFAFRTCLSRPPQDDELNRLVSLYEKTLARLKPQPEKAKKLATDPLGPAPEGKDITELAAWTVVGNVLLNLDEMLMKR
jgi:mono/diheme cytochrome c family protein